MRLRESLNAVGVHTTTIYIQPDLFDKKFHPYPHFTSRNYMLSHLRTLTQNILCSIHCTVLCTDRFEVLLNINPKITIILTPTSIHRP